MVQPVLFAMMVSLARLWQACGVEPDAVVGHSQGEIAAACVAGGLSLADGARIVALRSRLAPLLAGGRMASVWLGFGEVCERLERWDGRVVVAAVNSPGSVVVSGDHGAVKEFLARCEDDGIRVREVPAAIGAGHSPQVDGLREELFQACAGIAPRLGAVPFYSCVTGGVVSTDGLDEEYWFHNARDMVRFEGAVRGLLEDGHRTFVEMSPHPVLTAGVQQTVEHAAGEEGSFGGVEAIGSLRRGEGGPGRFLLSLGEAWVRGVPVNWGAAFEGRGARRVSLPTYAFQRERYWSDPVSAEGGEPAAGESRAGHPLLSSEVELADSRGRLFTGRLSPRAHPWLSDHALLGNPLLPGAALLEAALYAGARCGCETVHELVLEAPLVLDDDVDAEIQLVLGGPDERGMRDVGIYARPCAANDAGDADRPWKCHARGTLAPGGEQSREPRSAALTPASGAPWCPPIEAVELSVEDLRDRSASAGLEYGPVFSGLHAAWRSDAGFLAELSLPEVSGAHTDRFGIHPALLDAVLRTAASLAPDAQGVRVPLRFEQVRLHARAASLLRVQITPADGEAVSLELADEHGEPVLSIGSLHTRETVAGQLLGEAGIEGDALLRLDWVPCAPGACQPRDRWAVLGDGACVRALGSGSERPIATGCEDLPGLLALIEDGLPVPATVLVDCRGARVEHDLRGSVHDTVARILALAREWLSEDRLAGARLAVVTQGAVAADALEDVPDLPAASVWGLLRSAQLASPGRFSLVDVDGTESSWHALMAALSLDEPQLAIRDGRALAPRLARTRRDTGASSVPRNPFDPTGTVLIVDGLEGVGSAIARHLVVEHGVRSLVVAAGAGEGAPAARKLEDEISKLGARIGIVDCDLGDPAALEGLVGTVPDGHPLRGIVHCAPVTGEESSADSIDASLVPTPERIEQALAARVDVALRLDALTEELDLSAFVLFSSCGGTLGGGSGADAAADAALDAIAIRRRARQLPAVSIRWVPWGSADTSGGDPNLSVAPKGIDPPSREQAPRLFDLACEGSEPAPVAVRLDAAELRRQAEAGTLAPIFSKLVRASSRASRASPSSPLATRLVGLSDEERGQALLEHVRGEAAALLGHGSPESIDEYSAFLELGFDSITMVQLSRQLSETVGVTLSAAAVLEYPSPAALVRHLLARLADGSPAVGPPDTANAATASGSSHRAEGHTGSALSGSIGPLLDEAYRNDTLPEFIKVLAALSILRGSFDTVQAPDRASVVRLARGAAQPQLICVPSVLAISGPHQYARFAASFRDTRTVSALSLPGFTEGERVPASIEVLLGTLAGLVRESAHERPFAIVGHSSGGMLASALVEGLVRDGLTPAALLLIDTPIGFGDLSDATLRQLVQAMLERASGYLPLNDTRLTAMGSYARLLRDFEPVAMDVPTLLLRACEQVGDRQLVELDSNEAPIAQTVLEVPGDHFSMMEAHADSTAQAVQDWLLKTTLTIGG